MKPTRASVLTLGLPAPAAASPEVRIKTVDADAGLLLCAGAHGLSRDDVLELRTVATRTPGGTASALPAPLAEGVTYYARPATDSAMRLATAPSPAPAIASFADEGVGGFALVLSPWAALDQAIEDAWQTVLAHCTAHGGDVRSSVVEIAARYFAARLYVGHVAAGDPVKAQSYDGIASLWETTYRPLLDRYLAGVPVRGASDATPRVSEGSPRYRILGALPPSSTGWGTASAEVV